MKYEKLWYISVCLSVCLSVCHYIIGTQYVVGTSVGRSVSSFLCSSSLCRQADSFLPVGCKPSLLEQINRADPCEGPSDSPAYNTRRKTLRKKNTESYTYPNHTADADLWHSVHTRYLKISCQPSVPTFQVRCRLHVQSP